ncbi:MAG: AMP-binding protein [Bryobacteraceae bacterium]
MPAQPPIRTTLASLVTDFERHAQDVAVVSKAGLRRQATTYAELSRLTGRFAAELERRGIQKGERVLLWGDNGAPWIAAFFGCVLRGVVAVPIDAHSSAGFAEKVRSDVRPRLVAGSRDHIAGLDPETPNLAFEDFASVLPERGDTTPLSDLSERDTLQIIFTSGTTGEPKGIVHTHHNVLASLRPIESEMQQYLKYERIFHPLRFLHTLPLSHVFGQFMGLWIPALLGAELFFPPRLLASELIESIHDERISVVAAVPRVLDLLRTHLLTKFPDLPARLERARKMPVWRKWWLFHDVHHAFGLKFWAFVCGGASLDSEAEQFWLRLGFAVVQGYGMTETTALVSLNHPFKAASGSIGKVMPGREVRITPEGEILVRGETVSGATWQRGRIVPTESEWVATGDIAAVDEGGNLRFRGRTKEVIVTAAGLNIYPEDLEAEVLRAPGVTGCVVVASEDENSGPEPMAAVIAQSDDLAAEAVRLANDRLAAFQRIRRWTSWPDPDFPRTPNGKILRREVASALAARSQGPNGFNSSIARNELSQLVAESLHGTAATVDDNAVLDDLFDSLGRIEFLSRVEERFGVALTDTDWTQFRTLGDLRRFLLRDSRQAPGVETAEGIVRQDEEPRQAADEHIYPKWTWAWPQQMIRVAFLELIARPICWFLAKPRVVSQLASAPERPVLIVANHVTTYDAALVMYALPPKMRGHLAMAMSGEMLLDLRKGRNQGNALLNLLAPAGYFLITALFNVFPLPQRTGFRRSFAHAAAAMDHGYHVLVFPEGRRSDDGQPQPFKSGSGLLWSELRSPALPAYVEGLGEMKVAGQPWFRSGKLSIHIGSLIEAPDALPLEEATRLLERSVFSLARGNS